MTPPTRRRPGRRSLRAGFTLVELLISMVIVGVIGAALTRLIVAQSRFYNSQALQRGARDVPRGALNILQSDLRMVEETQGVVSASHAVLRIRVPYGVGFACNATTFQIFPVDSVAFTESRPLTAAIGLRNMTNGGYDIPAAVATYPTVTALDAATGKSVCTFAGLTPLPDGGYVTAPSLGVPVYAGQPVMLYRTVEYSIANSFLVPGSKGLFRRVGPAAAAAEEIVAPLGSSSSFQYYTLNSTTPTSAPATVKQIYGVRFNLIGKSELTDPATRAVQRAPLVTSVYFKNRKL